ncbi:hypothetical protein [Thermosulfurimonas sp. F29]|uniref:hypothetical protein n=1 Tax=Thermosulfurimonas sp. F29 TaxID=2867247 RepID=UPI001C83C9DA|nr:hypothetical protein [Thermosulfurimonas sp. F29]MBX6424188.1 hypothetical protein [Thermosulfurimonas sp. F29]
MKRGVLWARVVLEFKVPPLLNYPFITLDAPVLWAVARRFHDEETGSFDLEQLLEASPIATDVNGIPLASSPVAASVADAAVKEGTGTGAFLPALSRGRALEVVEETGGALVGAVLTSPNLSEVILKGIVLPRAAREEALKEVSRGVRADIFWNKQSGVNRDFCFVVPYRVFVSRLEFVVGLKRRFGRSDEELLADFEDLLYYEVGALGKLTRLGYGAFLDVLALPLEHPPRWPLGEDGYVLRPYPVRLWRKEWGQPRSVVNAAGWLPPYWYGARSELCYLPNGAVLGERFRMYAAVKCLQLEERGKDIPPKRK